MRDSNRVKILPPKISKTEFDSNQVYLLLEKQIFLFLSDSLDYLSHSTSSLLCVQWPKVVSMVLWATQCGCFCHHNGMECCRKEWARDGRVLDYVGLSPLGREGGALRACFFECYVFFTFFPAHPYSVLDYVGLSPRGREGGSYVPAIPTAAAADQNHRPHCWGRDTRECDEH